MQYVQFFRALVFHRFSFSYIVDGSITHTYSSLNKLAALLVPYRWVHLFSFVVFLILFCVFNPGYLEMKIALQRLKEKTFIGNERHQY